MTVTYSRSFFHFGARKGDTVKHIYMVDEKILGRCLCLKYKSLFQQGLS